MSEKKPIRYAFLQIPNYSMVTFSSAVASLRGANYISKETLYEWKSCRWTAHPLLQVSASK